MSNVVVNAATAAAWPDIVAARGYVARELASASTLEGAETTNDKRPIQMLKRSVTEGARATAGAAEHTNLGDTAITLLQGLSKLIVDRAKAEAVGWLLDQLGSELCAEGEAAMTPAQREISLYWLPSVCTLAHAQRLSGYGGGETMLEGLRRALESDLMHWPGAAASFAPAGLYVADRGQATIDSVLNCNLPALSQDAVCTTVNTIRAATRDGIAAVLKGADPLVSLRELSRVYGDANLANPQEQDRSFKSRKLQIAACGLGLPQDVHQGAAEMERSLPSAKERAHASIVAALVTVPACYEIVKVDRAPVPSDSPTTPPLSKLRTLFSLEAQLAVSASEGWVSIDALNLTIREFRAARAGLATASAKILNLPPPAVPNPEAGVSVFDTLTAYQAVVTNGVMGPAEWRMLRAIISVANAAVRVGEATLQMMSGTCATLTRLGGCGNIEPVKAALDDVRAYVEVAAEATNGDWSKVSLSLLMAFSRSISLRAYVPARPEAGTSKAQRTDSPTSNHATGLTDTRMRLLRRVGLLVAIASARDSDGVAKVLDQAAAPAGAWRGKGVPRATTVSVTAHAGLFGGAEWRHGAYGADYEDWDIHGQAPTLALPVGIEVAWGKNLWPSPFALFLSVIDPAAFLEYDVAKDSRLPGASLKTVLSPGLGVRLGFPNSPFSLIPMCVYRPGFRQWDSKFLGTGANALQVGLLLGIDVTLLEVSRSEGAP